MAIVWMTLFYKAESPFCL